MSQHRPNLVPAIFAILSLATSCVATARTVHAAPCIEKPNAPAPQGEHWYYRTDRAIGRQCWYLGPEDNNERGARQASDRPAPDVPVHSVAPPPAQQPATATPPAASATNFSTVTEPPSWPGATQLPLMPSLFQLPPTPAPVEQTQTSDPIDPPPAPASDAASEPESPASAQSSPVPAPIQSTEDADHTLTLTAMAFLTIAIFGLALEVMRWLRRRKSSNLRAPDWDALYQSVQASPGANSPRPPRRIPQPARSFVPPPPTSVVPPTSMSFADTEKLAEDLQKILDELRTDSFSQYEPSDLTHSG